MEWIKKEQLRQKINRLSSVDIPFLFLIDFKGENGTVIELSKLAQSNIHCSIRGMEYNRAIASGFDCATIEYNPIPFETYRQGFNIVQQHIAQGDSYLLNLTYPTQLRGNIDMASIYCQAQAPYKLMIKDHFLFYSPETFVRIEGNHISSYPMKGTINCNVPNAEKCLLESKKELFEHYTIVDLIRNDLSIVSKNVEVIDFRYIEKIHTHRGEIIQTSSHLRGQLPDNWRKRLGDILLALLPAGSISGAPKARCVEIIDKAEIDDRGFYSGIMGISLNGKIDSCVNIRYLEKKTDGTFVYRSGGGITALSNLSDEYDELLTKIYVPVN